MKQRVIPGSEADICTGKVRYRSGAEAEEEKLILSLKRRAEMEAYPCIYCKGWHVDVALE